jgi:hypothetical protein
MAFVEVTRMNKFTVQDLVDVRDEIQVDPAYQRNGAIWNPERKRLLIDSILQGYDIPKLYFRLFSPRELIDDRLYRYAVIDGRQRVETILDFVDGKFALGIETEVMAGADVRNLAGKRYVDLYDDDPDLAMKILHFPLDVVTVETEDLDVIDDMFLRLNEASPLNAAEKRNAFPGPLPEAARVLAGHDFFTNCLPYPNARFRHYDMASKFLYFEFRQGVADTKKTYLDRFVRTGATSGVDVSPLTDGAFQVLDLLYKVFHENDPLLQQVGMASVYYLVFRQAMYAQWAHELSRDRFMAFDGERWRNRQASRYSDSAGDYKLNEFDRFSQSPNDAVALRFRRDVLLEFLGHPLEQVGEDSPPR